LLMKNNLSFAGPLTARFLRAGLAVVVRRTTN
jgi:hypothetical protein